MAQHKAPTAVTVAPIQEKSGLGLWISRHWLHGALLALAIAAFIVFRYQREQGQEESVESSWEKLFSHVQVDEDSGLLESSDPAAIAALATDLKESPAGPSARLLEAEVRAQQRDYEGAKAALDALRRDHPNHPYLVAQFQFGDRPMSLADSLEKSIEDMRAFDSAHPGLLQNQDPPVDAPRVQLTTDQGKIVVALYSQLAPKHSENFLKLCREGFYAGTKFHRVIEGFMIQGGDPNSKAGEPATWGQGGPGYKIDPEPNGLFHFAGVLAMAKMGGDTQSSGSQFYITAEPAHGLDGAYTVFGKVVEGMDVVLRINSAPNAPNSDRPEAAVVLLSTEVL
jgi:peptidyl-prolyl cis-trans isomerase B (cyclophilin B)